MRECAVCWMNDWAQESLEFRTIEDGESRCRSFGFNRDVRHAKRPMPLRSDPSPGDRTDKAFARVVLEQPRGRFFSALPACRSRNYT